MKGIATVRKSGSPEVRKSFRLDTPFGIDIHRADRHRNIADFTNPRPIQKTSGLPDFRTSGLIRPDFRTGAFSLLEVILAIAIVAMILAAIAPALVGTLRAERQARRVLEPLAQEQVAFAILRDDLLAAPRPVGSVAEAFSVKTASLDGRRGDTLTLFSTAAPPLSPRIAARAPELSQAVITWQTQLSEDGRGLAWTRSRRANLLATGTEPASESDILLEHLAELTVETLTGTTWRDSYDSDDQDQVLPIAIRITYALLDENGEPGPKRQVVIDLPQVALDPLQTGGT